MSQMISDRPLLMEPNLQPSDDLSLVRLLALVTDTCGIHIQPQHQETFKKNIWKRVRSLGLASLDEYYQHLATTKQRLPGQTESHELIALLTVTETYFFVIRDRWRCSKISCSQN
jgi:chemotaxis methyl-accepting protein methylase